LVGWLAVIWED